MAEIKDSLTRCDSETTTGESNRGAEVYGQEFVFHFNLEIFRYTNISGKAKML